MVSRRLFIRILSTAIAASIIAPLALIKTAEYMVRQVASKPGSRVEGVTSASGETCLPMPRLEGSVSLEEAMANRRSIRSYLAEPLTLEELSQLLWAAYGVTETRYGFKTTPSAGATYPLEVYAVIAPRGIRVGENYLEPGSYHYNPHTHCISIVRRGDLTHALYEASLRQPWVRNAPLNIVITAVYERTTRVYGERGRRYVHMEVGHAGQNIYLQATALGLATVAVGAFYDETVREIIGAPPSHTPLYVMPVGRPVKPYHLDKQRLEKYYRSKRHRE